MKWPGRTEVDAAARQWARRLAAAEPAVRAVGYFGSYARGQAGVGSDLDLVVIVGGEGNPFTPTHPRGGSWATENLPVPADLLVYSVDQWQRLKHQQRHFFNVLRDQTVWTWGTPPQDQTASL
jgi:hypothetical protein